MTFGAWILRQTGGPCEGKLKLKHNKGSIGFLNDIWSWISRQTGGPFEGKLKGSIII
jgi:hypothetical protein